MSLYDWLLFLHVLAAFAFMAAMVVFWVLTIAARNADRPADALRYLRIAKPATALVIVGGLGTLVFGIWLAIDVDAYQVWDGWILAALVLWAKGARTSRARSWAPSSGTAARCGSTSPRASRPF